MNFSKKIVLIGNSSWYFYNFRLPLFQRQRKEVACTLGPYLLSPHSQLVTTEVTTEVNPDLIAFAQSPGLGSLLCSLHTLPCYCHRAFFH